MNGLKSRLNLALELNKIYRKTLVIFIKDLKQNTA